MSAPTPRQPGDLVGGDGVEVLLGVVHRGGHDRIVRRRQAQWRFVVQGLGHQCRERSKESIGGFVPAGPVDGPPQRVDHHFADQRRHRQNPRPVAPSGDQRSVEHHGDGLDVGVHHGLVLESGRDPCGLLGRQQIVS